MAKTYIVISRIGEYAPENAGKYEVKTVRGPSMRRGSQVIRSAIFNTIAEAKKYKKLLEK